MIEKGNRVYFGLMVGFLIVSVLGCIQFQSLDLETCRMCLVNLNVVSLLIMAPYRIRLAFDQEYMELVYPHVKKPWMFELPLFPCNTAEILFGLAIYLKLRILTSYCFFLGFVGPIMAFSDPPKGFEKGSLFDYKMFGFYITHYLTILNIPLLLASKIFIPGYKDIWMALGLYTIFSVLMYFFNRYMDTMDLGCPANYFFNMDPDYHPIFHKTYEFIPYRFWFTIPLILIVGIVLSCFVFILRLFV
ncbi:MAG: YwaF family protein [Bacillota bacterium]|nr:YwaF family protein [Bacillota bacterium]